MQGYLPICQQREDGQWVSTVPNLINSTFVAATQREAMGLVQEFLASVNPFGQELELWEGGPPDSVDSPKNLWLGL